MNRPSIKQLEPLIDRVLLSDRDLIRLWVARRRSGLQIKQLAARLGVAFTTMANYESGIRRPPVPVADAWRAALSPWLEEATVSPPS